MIDRDMNRKELSKHDNVSSSTLTKLSKCESVNAEMLIRICAALKCELWDIMDLLPEDDGEIVNIVAIQDLDEKIIIELYQ